MFPRLARHRQIAEPELVAESSEDSDEGTWHPEREESSEDEEEEEEEVDDEVSVGKWWESSHFNQVTGNMSLDWWPCSVSG